MTDIGATTPKTPSQIQDERMEAMGLHFYADFPSREDAGFRNTSLECRGGPYPYDLGIVYAEDGVTVLPGIRFYIQTEPPVAKK